MSQRQPRSCGKRAGSCGHEAQDAAFYAAHAVNYVKDDACGPCGNDSSLDSYGKMQRALWATGQPTVLAVEGSPPLANLTRGGYGNSSRVGADIRPVWDSIVTLIDQGSGMWPYAGGVNVETPFYNDFDILESVPHPGGNAGAMKRVQWPPTIHTHHIIYCPPPPSPPPPPQGGQRRL